jgi:hypothetical protein
MVMRKLALFVDGIRIESALAIAFIISVAWLGALTFVLLVPHAFGQHPRPRLLLRSRT